MAHPAAFRPCLLTLAMLLLLPALSCTSARPIPEGAAGETFSQPADLPSLDELNRGASIVVVGERSAVEFERCSTTATITGSALELIPNYQGRLSGAAWGIYRFGMAEPVENKPLRLYWGNAPSDGLYVGLSDFDKGRWKWIEPEDPSFVDPGELSPYVRENGDLYVAVVLTGDQQLRLDGLRFSDEDGPFPVMLATPGSGSAPLDVLLDASESHNFQGVLLHSWDLDGNGSYEVDTGAVPQISFQLDRLDGNYSAGVMITAEELDYEARATISIEGNHFTIPPAESFVDFKPEGSLEDKWLFNCYAPLPAFSDDNRVFQTVYFAGQADVLFNMTNELRSGLGLDTLTWDPHLELIAQAHSRHMALLEFFDHEDPYNFDPAERLGLVNAPFWTMSAENIFAGNYTGALTYEQMVNSPGHYDNATLPGITHIGIGCYQHDGSMYGTYWTMVFTAGFENPNAHDWLEPQEVE